MFSTLHQILCKISVFIFFVIPIKLKEFFNYQEARQILFWEKGSRNWIIQ
jgi:hypothetical protein